MEPGELEGMISEIILHKKITEDLMDPKEIGIIEARIRERNEDIEHQVKEDMGFKSFEPIPPRKKEEFRKRVKKKHLEG